MTIIIVKSLPNYFFKIPETETLNSYCVFGFRFSAKTCLDFQVNHYPRDESGEKISHTYCLDLCFEENEIWTHFGNLRRSFRDVSVS